MADREVAGHQVIGLDIDECICQFTSTFHSWVEKYKSGQYTYTGHIHYAFERMYGVEKSVMDMWLAEFYTSEEFHKIPLVDGALEHIPVIAQHFEVHIVTARSHELADHTTEWLSGLFPGCFKSFQFGNHHGLDGKRMSKSEMCKAVGATLLIDDNTHYLNDCESVGVQGILFGDYAWNRHDQEKTRVLSWSEMLSVLRS